MPGRTRPALTILLVAAMLSLLWAAPVPASVRAPACATSLAPVQPVRDIPWALHRYLPERITPFATGAGVTVAVIDSGVDKRHPQLRGQILDGADFLDSGRDGTDDCTGHGTAVASIIAAKPIRGAGLRGLAPDVRILPVRVSEQHVIEGRESGRTVTARKFAAAIRWAVDKGADVLNLSVVLYADEPVVHSAIRYAIKRNVVVVAAVGNLHANGDPRPYPAAYDGVLGVGAITEEGARAEFSQTGTYVDLVAPGTEILGAAPGRGHRSGQGTSYSAPFVSATAALIRQYQPRLTAEQVAERILRTTDPARGTDHSLEYGHGVLNPYRAVTDTLSVVAPAAQPAVPISKVDPASTAWQQRRSAARDKATLVAGVAGGVTIMALLVAMVFPRGRRRRWHAAGPG